ncbi:sugar transporter [Phlyctema vagabunda]|uniref:Sugar transporter n=1 Tax=Phlyctema vagabunda TaxID=108571 RepID=A0ABR4P438_9HELO
MSDVINTHSVDERDVIAPTPQNEKTTDVPLQHVEDNDSRPTSDEEETRHDRKNSVYSNSGRRMTEWEAIQIAAAGDLETINAEIDEIDLDLQNTPRSTRWYNYELNFKDPRHFTWLLVFFASMGGLLSGVDQSLISGANLSMPSSLDLTVKQVSLVSSGVPLGAIGGALILGPVNEAVGRRMAIIISCVLYTVGGALEAGAINYGMMVAARVILGMGLGLEGGTVPVYVAESVSRKYRGNLVSLYQFMIALGEVLGYVISAMFVNVKSGAWRYMLGSSLVFSTIMFFGILFMPESPRFLMHKGHTTEAWGVWKRIRGTDDDARKEFFVLKHSVEEEQRSRKEREGGQHRFVWMDFITQPRARRSIIYANIMVFLGQFTGINAIQYYMATLLTQVGFDDKDAVFMSLVGGGALLIGTIPAVLYMERFGRRFWAIAMLPGFFIGLVLVGISYLIPLNNKAGSQGLYLTGLIVYEGFFGSYAALTWVLPSEVYPTYLRSYGMETSDVTLFLCSFLVTYFFSQMQEAMSRIGLTLGFYGGIAVIGWFYQILFMPETKNKTLEEIDIIFSQPTKELVKENLRSSLVTADDFIHLRWRKVFSSEAESEIYKKTGGLGKGGAGGGLYDAQVTHQEGVIKGEKEL